MRFPHRREFCFFAFFTVFPGEHRRILRWVQDAVLSIGELPVVKTHLQICPVDFCPLLQKFSRCKILSHNRLIINGDAIQDGRVQDGMSCRENGHHVHSSQTRFREYFEIGEIRRGA